MNQFPHKELTGKNLEAFYYVYNKIGFGFEKQIYQNGMTKKFGNLSVNFEKEQLIPISFEKEKIGEFKVDFIVERKVVVMIGNSKEIESADSLRLENIVKQSEYDIGLFVNFGMKPDQRRKIWDQYFE